MFIYAAIQMIDAPRGRGKQGIREREKIMCIMQWIWQNVRKIILHMWSIHIIHISPVWYSLWYMEGFFWIGNLKNSLVWNPKSNWLAFISCIIKAYFDQKFWHALDFGLRLRLTTTPPTSDAAAPRFDKKET